MPPISQVSYFSKHRKRFFDVAVPEFTTTQQLVAQLKIICEQTGDRAAALIEALHNAIHVHLL